MSMADSSSRVRRADGIGGRTSSAEPSLVVHLKRHGHVDLPARATPVDDAATRRAVLDHLSATWYRNQQPIDVLVETAPMVEVVFDEHARLSAGERRPAGRHRELCAFLNTSGSWEVVWSSADGRTVWWGEMRRLGASVMDALPEWRKGD